MEKDEVASPLLRRYFPLLGLSSFVDPFVTSILTWAARFRSRHPRGEATAPIPNDTALEPQNARDNTPQGSTEDLYVLSIFLRVEIKIPCLQLSLSQLPPLLESVPLDPPSCSQFFGLQRVVLQSYKGLLSSYEEASGCSSQVGQLENELKALRREKAREEGFL
ncbi:hypothetical protein LIER_31827 [Lithospermum erythrorhizon]|uniref:Uncharacterized protein n=1 Tax=Lithospermum erythrorhizon TaxID=34254 RepID=A0AAV3RSV7_LITER